jgi:hypothetical protein
MQQFALLSLGNAWTPWLHTHTCCIPETPHSRSCKENSWAVWEFYKHQHLLYSYSMYKPCLTWKDTSFHIYFSSTLSFEIFSTLCMVFLYTELLMQGLHETFGDILSITHTSPKYSKWTLFNWKHCWCTLQQPAFGNSQDMIVSYFSIVTGEGSSYHAYKSWQTAFSSAQGDDKSNSLEQIKEHRIHCIMLYILSQYFLICFNYLE